MTEEKREPRVLLAEEIDAARDYAKEIIEKPHIDADIDPRAELAQDVLDLVATIKQTNADTTHDRQLLTIIRGITGANAGDEASAVSKLKDDRDSFEHTLSDVVTILIREGIIGNYDTDKDAVRLSIEKLAGAHNEQRAYAKRLVEELRSTVTIEFHNGVQDKLDRISSLLGKVLIILGVASNDDDEAMLAEVHKIRDRLNDSVDYAIGYVQQLARILGLEANDARLADNVLAHVTSLVSDRNQFGEGGNWHELVISICRRLGLAVPLPDERLEFSRNKLGATEFALKNIKREVDDYLGGTCQCTDLARHVKDVVRDWRRLGAEITEAKKWLDAAGAIKVNTLVGRINDLIIERNSARAAFNNKLEDMQHVNEALGGWKGEARLTVALAVISSVRDSLAVAGEKRLDRAAASVQDTLKQTLDELEKVDEALDSVGAAVNNDKSFNGDGIALFDKQWTRAQCVHHLHNLLTIERGRTNEMAAARDRIAVAARAAHVDQICEALTDYRSASRALKIAGQYDGENLTDAVRSLGTRLLNVESTVRSFERGRFAEALGVYPNDDLVKVALTIVETRNKLTDELEKIREALALVPSLHQEMLAETVLALVHDHARLLFQYNQVAEVSFATYMTARAAFFLGRDYGHGDDDQRDNDKAGNRFDEWYKEHQFDDARPTIVCLCGSTRFIETFYAEGFKETLKGNIVLTVGCTMRGDVELFGEMSDEGRKSIKEALDKLHLRKIDLADEVLILNRGGYIGESTRNELRYALKLHKRIRFLEPDRVQYHEGELLSHAPSDSVPPFTFINQTEHDKNVTRAGFKVCEAICEQGGHVYEFGRCRACGAELKDEAQS